MNNDIVWGVGDASRAYGPDIVFIDTNQKQLIGNFYLYGEDYVDFSNRGTLINISPTVTVTQGDIWNYTP